MTARPILRWPDPRLSQVCVPIGNSEGLDALVGDMFQTMYDANGRGLAAPQVGEMIRLFVMDTGWKDGDMRPMVCIDPEILDSSDETLVMAEGCLSIPGIVAHVTRPERIVLAYTDLSGLRREEELSGAEARCAQHEMDHLDGKVHFDRLEFGIRAELEAEYAVVAGSL